MEFSILGPLRVGPPDEPIDLGGRFPRGLLSELLASPNVTVSDDRLIDELWGETPPPSARHLLQVYVSRLRKVLAAPGGSERIIRHGPGYLLRLEPGELDADRFLDAVAAGREIRDRRPAAAEKLLASALGLWRGTPFEDVIDAPAIREQAAYLDRLYREALQTRIELRLELGQHRELIPELVSLVGTHPYDECLAGHLMVAMYRSGRQAEALQAGRALRTRLRDDLGIDPSPEQRALYHRMLVQDPDLLLEAQEPSSNLPLPLSSFVGRTGELGVVADLLIANRVVTLTGPPGIGKSRLALEVARHLVARFPDGLVWIDLASVAGGATVALAVGAALDVRVGRAGEEIEAAARALARRRALVILDNCEVALEGTNRLVAAVLGSTVGPRFLTTSRAPLGVDGEQVWNVPPLPLPPRDAGLGDVGSADAVRLFMDRARAVVPGFSLRPDNVAAVVGICRRLDGLPLAIEMAAARLPVLSPTEIDQHLGDRLGFLGSVASRRADHVTMNAAIGSSHAALPEERRLAFERMSVFGGAFDLEAAAAIAVRDARTPSAVLETVAALVRGSMLVPVRAGPVTRYRLLETLRAFAADRLRTRPAEELRTQQAHAAHYLGIAAAGRDALETPAFAAVAARLAAEGVELGRALDWSLTHDPRAVTLRAASGLRELWYRRGDAAEAMRWTALMLDGDLSGVLPEDEAEVHCAAAFAANLAMDLPRAESEATRAAELARRGGSWKALAFALWGQSHVAFARGDLGAMRQAALAALEVCDRSGNRWARARPMTSLGYAALFGGQPGQARRWFEEAIRPFRELGDIGSLVLMALVPLSVAALDEHDFGAAERWATEAIESSTGMGWAASGLVQYAVVRNEAGAWREAGEAARRGLRVAVDAGLGQWVHLALRELARAAAGAGEFETAASLAGGSRQSMPAPSLDPRIYGEIEGRCRPALGNGRFEQLFAAGGRMSVDELIALAGIASLPEPVATSGAESPR